MEILHLLTRIYFRKIVKIDDYSFKNLDAKIITTEKDYSKINPDNEIKFLQIELNIKNEIDLINYLKSNI